MGCMVFRECYLADLYRARALALKLTCMPVFVQAITAAFVVSGLITFRNIKVVRTLSKQA